MPKLRVCEHGEEEPLFEIESEEEVMWMSTKEFWERFCSKKKKEKTETKEDDISFEITEE